MPRVTRSTKATAAPATRTAATHVTNAVKDSKVLQAKSTNVLKRPLADDRDKKGKKAVEPAAKKTRFAKPEPAHNVSQSSASKVSDDIAAKLEESDWGVEDVEGVYDIFNAKCSGDEQSSIDTTDFSLKLFYYGEGNLRQLYATFVFDKLEGIIRFRPEDELNGNDHPNISLAKFETLCNLSPDDTPGPSKDFWRTRWRGKEGQQTLRRGQLVGGDWPHCSSWAFLKSSSELAADGSVVMKIIFHMVHNYKAILFFGRKTRNLESECRDPPWILERKWNELYDEDWASDSEDESESESNLGPTPSIYTSTKVAPNKQRREKLPKQKTKPQPQSKTTSLTDQGPGKRADSGMQSQERSRDRTIGQSLAQGSESQASYRSNLTHDCPAWAWDVTGEWKVAASEPFRHMFDLETNDDIMMDFFMTDDGVAKHQLWATIEFGDKSRGVVRFYPRKLDAWGNSKPFGSLEEFEDACVLDSTCWPGPKTSEGEEQWICRWRDMNRLAGPQDMIENMVTFKKDDDGKLTLAACFNYSWLMLGFNAKKIGEHDMPLQEDMSVHTIWSSCKASSLSGPKRAHLSEKPKAKQRVKALKPAYMSAAEIIPQEIPGTNGKMCIELLPDWAWDVTGKWKITAPELAKALDLDTKYPMEMEILVANNHLHTKIGRQLWAQFDFKQKGIISLNNLRGTLRFCPFSAGEAIETLKQFENACILKSGVWPGPLPSGEDKWYVRCREKKAFEGSDKHQTQFKFGMEKGHLTLKGIMFYDNEPYPVEAVKVRNTEPKATQGVSVTTAWAGSKPDSEKRSSGRTMYIVARGGLYDYDSSVFY